MDNVSAEKRSENMRRIQSRDTQPERVVRSILHRLGYRFRLRSMLPGRPDVVLPKHQAVVFVHGCFWHSHGCSRGNIPKSNRAYWRKKLEGNAARDRRNAAALRNMGWRVVVIWECRIKDRESARRMIERLMSRVRQPNLS